MGNTQSWPMTPNWPGIVVGDRLQDLSADTYDYVSTILSHFKPPAYTHLVQSTVKRVSSHWSRQSETSPSNFLVSMRSDYSSCVLVISQISQHLLWPETLSNNSTRGLGYTALSRRIAESPLSAVPHSSNTSYYTQSLSLHALFRTLGTESKYSIHIHDVLNYLKSKDKDTHICDENHSLTFHKWYPCEVSSAGPQ